MDAATAWAAVGALATVATAGIAAFAASQSRHSTLQANAAAASANKAAEALTAIERDRRHDELTPQFELTCLRESRERAELRIELVGGRLESLDEVTVTILDEASVEHWGAHLPADVTQAEAEAFVWGGWEFLTAARQSDHQQPAVQGPALLTAEWQELGPATADGHPAGPLDGDVHAGALAARLPGQASSGADHLSPRRLRSVARSSWGPGTPAARGHPLLDGADLSWNAAARDVPVR